MQIIENWIINTVNGQNLIQSMRLVEGKSDYPNLSVCSNNVSYKNVWWTL